MPSLVWSVVTNVDQYSPFANRGLSLVSCMYEGEEFLVSFGGFNGLCSNEINVLRPSYKNYAQDRLMQTPRSCNIAPRLPRPYASSEDELLSEAEFSEWMRVLWGELQFSDCKREISKGAEASRESNKEPELEESECSLSDHRMNCKSELSKGAETFREPNKEPELDETDCSNSDRRKPCLSPLEFQEKFSMTQLEFFELYLRGSGMK